VALTCGPGRIITLLSLITASISSAETVTHPESERIIMQKVMRTCVVDGKIHHGTFNRRKKMENKSAYFLSKQSKNFICLNIVTWRFV
jgi:hypothetical protein